ncbi:MAG: ribonuclease E/G [Bacillus sp. (in: Bacteria)]|nr:ribonuclease E/G [Bacillus sp. (in: firmicutes)]MCM1425903.1 ribonuclease E/G [Eubacterium sp.]
MMTQDTQEKGKILIVELHDKLFSVLVRQNQALSIHAQQKSPDKEPPRIGNIYVARVRNVAVNIGAAFVEIDKGILTFLPLAEAKHAVFTNRKTDGTLKIGDELLVQVVKEPVKTKLAGVSTALALAGTYVVIEKPQEDIDDTKASGQNTRTGSIRISSKLGAKYHHLYQNLDPLAAIADKFHITIRTNAAGAEDTADVIAEARSLAAKLEHILEIGDKRVCFSCLYQSEPEYIGFIKNCYRTEYDEIVTDNKEIYDILKDHAELSGLPLRLYEDDRLPLYKLYSLETRIQGLTEKKVFLKSGAYLVIEQTEALIAIDVNTGKYESRKTPEETYLKINLEAAEAIAAALRARNLSGMILVDFINMKKKEHMERLTSYMKELLKKDTVPAYVVDITGLGLMEITRQKKNKSFAEQMKGTMIPR